MLLRPTRVHTKFGGFHISAPGYTQNPPDFRPKPLARNIWGRMQYAPTRVHQKPGGFWTLPHDMARNPTGFGLCHSTWRKTWRVLDFATRHSAKPGGFYSPQNQNRLYPEARIAHSTGSKGGRGYFFRPLTAPTRKTLRRIDPDRRWRAKRVAVFYLRLRPKTKQIGRGIRL